MSDPTRAEEEAANEAAGEAMIEAYQHDQYRDGVLRPDPEPPHRGDNVMEQEKVNEATVRLQAFAAASAGGGGLDTKIERADRLYKWLTEGTLPTKDTDDQEKS